MKSLVIIGLLLITLYHSSAQEKEYVTETFKSTRVINSHSVQVLDKRTLDFRVVHRFGDFAGRNGGASTFFGIDDAADIQISFEYGITDKFTAGVGRNKGAGAVKQLWNSYLKYNLLTQTKDNKTPFTVTAFTSAVVSSMRASSDSTDATYFPTLVSRISYASQLLIAKKMGERFSLQVMPTFVYRNFVAYGDENGIFALGLGARLRITKSSAIIIESFYPFSKYRMDQLQQKTYFIPVGVAYEIQTGGHIFHINFTNSRGVLLNDFIPYSPSNWLAGGFRFGFTISRVFRL